MHRPRTFDAPPDLVWQMWTDPDHFARWYGPPGAKVPVAKMDVKAGGTRLICMEVTTPDGPMQMWFTGEYLDVMDGGTKMVMTHAGIPADSPGATGWTMAFDKLVTYLEAQKAD